MMRYLKKASTAAGLLLSDRWEFALRWRRAFHKPRSGPIRIRGVRFDIDLDLDPLMVDMFYCTYEHRLTELMKRVLRPGDGFLDVGANVGYTSAVALGLVGRRGEVHAFEPVPCFLERLEQVRRVNPGYSLVVNGCALGQSEGEAMISVTNVGCMGWNTMVPDFMSRETTLERLPVKVTTLDSYLRERPIPRLRFVKIDVEGFELPVIRGFREYLSQESRRPVIVIEVTPAAYARLNSQVSDLFDFMDAFGYTACDMDLCPLPTPVTVDKSRDVVFLPADYRGR